MKRHIIILSLLLLTTGSLAASGTAAHLTAHDPAYDMFYDDLQPYGEWIEVDAGVLVWRPRFVYRDWRPYSIGRWVWTRHGWYWLSNEPFGWAVFHYGRWSMHPRFGWIWHPGRVWGPAWVEWRYSNAYLGWAPLPPAAIFHATFGVRFTRHWVAPVDAWCFIPYQSFGTTRYRDHLLPQDRVRRIIGTTRRGRTATINRDVVFNRGVDRNVIERRGSVRVERFDIREGSSAGSERVRGREIQVYRPERSVDRQERGSRQNESRRDPTFRTPTRRDSPERDRNAYARPQSPKRDVQSRPSRPTIPDRKVAPNVRSRPDRSAPSQPKRSRTPRSGRSRDN